LIGINLLVLEKSEELSSPDRQLLYIRGGLLASENIKGRLEFRRVLGGKYVMSALHDYSPRVPWTLYKFTQAKFHLWVMLAYGRYLKKIR
jgi:hypothetical protein